MKSIIIILPYFGRFPSYFPLYLKSCAANHTITWLLVTDQTLKEIIIPDNFIVKNSAFYDIQKKAERLFGKAPDTPYALCKYKVVYHELFKENIRGFDFWGFCDCDLIFGNLRYFITDEVLDKYDKISWRGHLTLFKNNLKINNAYKIEYPGFKTFKGCINNSDGINLFDEVGINKIFKKLGLKIYEDMPFADLVVRNNNFVCHYDYFDSKTNLRQIFRWIEGNLYRIYVSDNQMYSETITYVHFLKRPMKWEDSTLLDSRSFLIVPNRFIADENLTVENVLKYSKKKIYWKYIIPRLTPKFLINKIKYLFRMGGQQPDIYVRHE